MDELKRTTIFRTISNPRQNSLIITSIESFELIFTELDNKIYYLTTLQETDQESKTVNKTIKPSDRCRNLSELFNQTFLQWHLLRRMKYYHLPCQNQSLNLSCFHDEYHFCFCYPFRGKRLANCFNFTHNMTFDCYGQSECENDAQCFQETEICPRRSVCKCQSCFYGSRCQFSTSGLGLSLDSIIGYQIVPHIGLTEQSAIVQFSLGMTIFFFLAGIIDGIISLITFQNKHCS